MLPPSIFEKSIPITDGKYKINGLLTDINDTKTHLNNSIENELESEQNNQSESTE